MYSPSSLWIKIALKKKKPLELKFTESEYSQIPFYLPLLSFILRVERLQSLVIELKW